MPLELYTGNRLELLADALCEKLGRELPASPFEREIIVVQSRGMQRWLSMHLASRFGIWANGYFPFPNALVRDLFGMAGLEQPDSPSYAREAMGWKIMRILPGLLAEDAFAPLRAYLSNDADGLKLFQLSFRIADTFDQYTLFRPDHLERWESGQEELSHGWQPALWRAIVREAGGKHRAMLKTEFCRSMGKAGLTSGGFPARVSIFGVSFLPPFHVEMLSALATVSEVNLFILSPTREYWSDIVSRRDMARLPAAERMLRTEGNPLLASLGRTGRDFSDMVVDLADSAEVQSERYVDPGDDTLLHAIQSDMLNLRGSGDDAGSKPLDPSDRSVQLHSCHSPMREVEVLHDNLLELLRELPGLAPRDILVMTPDIETYAPYISSVFGAATDGRIRLPFTIADRSLLNEGRIASAVVKLLGIYGSRLTAPAVFDLLSSPPVRRRFGFDDGDLDRIRHWIENARIRWGLDEGDRRRHRLPVYRENSWRAGLDRLLLGYAMPDEGLLFDGILPFDGIEGESAVVLGRFAHFIDRLDWLAGSFEKPKCLREWQELFREMLDAFIEAGEEEGVELAALHESIDTLGEALEREWFTGDVSARVMIAWLTGHLEKAEQGLGFMTGGITFCAMLPMRSIPFRVVAMIGMNDGAFPRNQRPPGFDLISGAPRRGDRSVRGDDRYLFLESILSARDVLYISYTGQSIRDNAEIPPSVLVSELLDSVRRGFDCSGCADGDPADLLLVRHRLQGFHPDYFTGKGRLFSYDADNFSAIEGRNSPLAKQPFIQTPLALPAEEPATVSIDELARFFANPSAFFLKERLGVMPATVSLPLEDRETFSLDSLDAYLMRQEILNALAENRPAAGLLPLFRSRGILPPSRHGERLFHAMVADVSEFFAAVQAHTPSGSPLEPLALEIEVGGIRLAGTLDTIFPGGQLFARCAAMKATDRIRAWLSHLLFNLSPVEGRTFETRLVMRDRILRYAPIDSARELLEQLLSAYRKGLSEPLPFFPKCSTAWCEANGKAEHERLDAALRAWNDGYDGRPGEGSDPAVNRCFGDEPPFGDMFRNLADALIGPMIMHGGKP